MQTYKKKAFQLVHCWTILRNCPKFAAATQKKIQKPPNDSPKSSGNAQSPFISNPSQDSDDKMERPMGRKDAKILKRAEHESRDDEFVMTISITQAKDTMSRLSESRNENIQQLIELENERLRAVEEREKARKEREQASDERERAREERENQMDEISILAIVRNLYLGN